MRAFIWLLGLVTIICILGFLFSLVSERMESAGLPTCGIGLISGILYLLLASRQSRIDKDRKEDERARKLAAAIVRQQNQR